MIKLSDVMDLEEAFGEFLEDGMSIAFGGMGGIQSVAETYEVVRQGVSNLTLIGDSPCEPGDILVGTGQIDKLEIGWLGYAVAGISNRFRDAVENNEPHEIEVEEYSNYTMGLRFLAGALGVPYLPTKSLLGSSIPEYNENITVQEDPRSGEYVALVPAANPDVGVIHAHRADPQGNTQFLSFSSNAGNIARASDKTIVTVENIIDTEEIREFSFYTLVPEYAVDAVVELPFSSHPWNMPYEYAYDIPFHMDQMKQMETREGFLEWLDEWCYGMTHEDYCEKVGYDRLLTLKRVERKFTKKPVLGG